MILKKVYISRGGVKANLEKVYILIFFMTASLSAFKDNISCIFNLFLLALSIIINNIDPYLISVWTKIWRVKHV